MARKKGETYFNTFVELVGYSCKAAELLKEILNDFDSEMLPQKMKEMHEIEHSGDEASSQDDKETGERVHNSHRT